jgi:hypothetical protein
MTGTTDPVPILISCTPPTTVLEVFKILFPVDYMKQVVITETSKVIDGPLSNGELLRWFGIWFLMAKTNSAHCLEL